MPPTVGGEVVGDILTQTHSPDALLELVHDSVTDQAGSSCTQNTPSAASKPYLALVQSPPPPYTRLKAQGAFSSEKWVPSLPASPQHLGTILQVEVTPTPMLGSPRLQLASPESSTGFPP